MLDRNQKKQNQAVIKLLDNIIIAINEYLQQPNNLNKFKSNESNRKTNIYNIIFLVYEAIFDAREAKNALGTLPNHSNKFLTLHHYQSRHSELKNKIITSLHAKNIITEIIALLNGPEFKTGVLKRSELKDRVLEAAKLENIETIIQEEKHQEEQRLLTEKNIMDKDKPPVTGLALETLPTEIRNIVLESLDPTSLSQVASVSSTLFKSSKALKENTAYWQNKIQKDFHIDNIDNERLNPNESDYDLYQRLAAIRKINIYVVIQTVGLNNLLDIINSRIPIKIFEQKIIRDENDLIPLLANALRVNEGRYIMELAFKNAKEKDLFLKDGKIKPLKTFAHKILSFIDLNKPNAEKVQTIFFRGKLIEKPAEIKSSEPKKPGK